MKKIVAAVVVMLALAGCEESKTSSKNQQAAKAAAAADSIVFTENAEIDNIKKRLELTSNPGALGYVLLMNQAGQPIMYTSVKGKITSGSKRLTKPDYQDGHANGANVRQAPSDEGTYGSSDPYIYFWTMNGDYIQWNGAYLYSNKPIRTKVEPLVINVQAN